MNANQSDREMKDYYKERAPVYDRVYAYPERQDNLRFLENYVPDQFDGKNVVEIAAGTGYWRQFVSQRAKSILATDITAEALAQINFRDTKCAVETRVADAYSMDNIEGGFDGAFAGLWFSHIPVERRREWLAALHSHLDSGATVFLLDNSRAQCERLPLSHTDDQGNTFQERETDSGERYQVLKNFPTESELIELTTDLGCDHRFSEMDHFWFFQYVSN